MKKSIIILLILLVGVGGIYLFYKEGVMAVDKNDKNSKIFVIRPGESLAIIANNLAKEDLIRNKIVFYLITKQLGIDRKIQAGDFRLSPSMDAYEVARNLTHGTLDIWITVIEGLRKDEIAHVISQKIDIPEIEFIKLADEGYLFPDTYLFPRQATAGAVIKIMTDNFNNRFDDNLRAQAKSKGLTEYQVLILASLVEKEARHPQDKQKVASIIIKRLKAGWPLQIDATIQFALGYQPDEKTWWKKNLTKEDLAVNSPYNTYKNPGLPPGPISSPGLESIRAVVNYDPDTPYWYYISDKNGNMHYGRTDIEHNENIRKYLQ